MKQSLRIIAFILSSFFITHTASAQGFAINTNSAAADASAMLDVASNSQGVLLPRMDSADRTLISNPATGLIVYQTDGVTPGFYNYNGSTWQKVGTIVQPHVQTYTTAGTHTFTTSANVTTATLFKVTLVAGGGGGGGGTSGGGGGGALITWVSGLAPNTAYTINVGLGGIGNIGGGAGAGGTSSAVLGAANLSCSGGGAGSATGLSTGGVPNGGSLNFSGQPGGANSGTGGNGGNSLYGTGGVPFSGNSSTSGKGYGAGGAGASSSLFTGGNGTAGVAIIEWSE